MLQSSTTSSHLAQTPARTTVGHDERKRNQGAQIFSTCTRWFAVSATRTVPSEEVPTPYGLFSRPSTEAIDAEEGSSPLPVAGQPMKRTKRPSAVKTCSNYEGADSADVKVLGNQGKYNVNGNLNKRLTCIRLFPQSATKISPLPITAPGEDEEVFVQTASTAMPRGSLNCPSPQPGVPKDERKAPSGENTCRTRNDTKDADGKRTAMILMQCRK
jgi:hypothetical protein